MAVSIRRIRSKAPLRISFCGGGTDVLPYAAEHGGVVLNATIDRYAYASLVDSGQTNVSVHSLDLDLMKRFDLDQPLVYDGQLDLAKAVLQWLNHGTGGELGGFDLHLRTDAPPGSGLGSSSAVVVAMLAAVSAWRRQPLTAYEMAHLAYILEREELGIVGGMQDQYAASFGGFNLIEFHGTNVSVNPLRVPAGIINELEYSLVLCYLGGTRMSAHILDAQIGNYRSGHAPVLAAMEELKSLTLAMKNALVLGKLSQFGALLHQAWMNKKQMAQAISNPRIDEIYEEARRHGALGGKISGAGGGGYMYFYCPDETCHKVSARLEGMGLRVTRFSFEQKGVQTWEVAGN